MEKFKSLLNRKRKEFLKCNVNSRSYSGHNYGNVRLTSENVHGYSLMFIQL